MYITVIMKIKCLSIDEKTIELLDNFSKKHSLSRSATLRLIVNEFFLKKDRN